MPYPWKVDVRRSLLSSLRASLDRLGLKTVDLYQIHGPISFRSHAAIAEALAAAHQAGLVRAVGVSNYSAKETRAVDARSGPGDCGSPRTRSSSRCCVAPRRTRDSSPPARSSGSSLSRYSPIGQGRLSGKYSATNPPKGKRTFSAHPMAVVDSVVAELRRVGDKHGGKTPSQVALNWIMAKGVVPIPGAKDAKQAEDNAGALGWSIDDEDRAALDDASLEGIRNLSSRFWQHG